MNTHPLTAVILAGGGGTRLWPVSRRKEPKQFMTIDGRRSLLGATVARIRPIVPESCDNGVWVITNDALASGAGYSEFQGLNYVLEPVGRNTAPAIGVMAAWLADFAGNPDMLILPADHVITDEPAFHRAVDAARTAAAQGALVTFGIRPSHPETGFGYIRAASGTADGPAVPVVEFVEKPDQDTARRYLADGGYTWNSGMFVARAGVMLDEIARHAPDIADVLERMRAEWRDSRSNGARQRAVLNHFADMPSISIDYAVMEKSDRVMVVPCDIGWSDVGSWDAVYALADKDISGNAVQAQAQPVLLETSNCYIKGGERLIAAVGVEDLCIIDTPDALLVARRGETQKVREVVDEVASRNGEAHLIHRTAHRPWGSYTVMEEPEGGRYKTKRIDVRPGGRLSLQSHRHRSEHWVVVAGTATVTCGERVFDLQAGESTYIPCGEKHRLENRTDAPLKMIEVQVGDYLGEDDIVRYDDAYARVRMAS